MLRSGQTDFLAFRRAVIGGKGVDMAISWKTMGWLAAGGIAGAFIARRLRKRYSFRDNVIIVTGGVRGLGLELARVWANEGARLVICSRTPDEVDWAVKELTTQGTDVFGYVCDITQKEKVHALVDAVIEHWGRIDVLVNNAGIIQAGPLSTMTLNDFDKAMKTHFWGPLFAIQAVLPQMRNQGNGRIVNISSIGGKVSVPHLLPYCASKFALTGLSKGLRTELSKDGIYVTTVCPGLMRTGSPRNAEFKGSHQAKYAWFSIADSLPIISIDSRAAAKKIVEGCRCGDVEMTLSPIISLAARGYEIFPDLSAEVLDIVNRFLPQAPGGEKIGKRGENCFSSWSPSWLTTLSEKAALRNHEILNSGGNPSL